MNMRMNVKLKEIIKKSILYRLYRTYKKKRSKKYIDLKSSYFKKEGVETLKFFVDALHAEGVQFWLEFGTLLGYYREHDFIPYDLDLDFGAYLKDADRVKKALTQSGFELIRYYFIDSGGGREECYVYKDFMTTLDVFYFETEDNRMYCHTFSPRIQINKKKNLNKECPFSVRRLYFPNDTFIKDIFKGIEIYVPNDTYTHLEAVYGPNFMIPDPDFEPLKRPNIVSYPYKIMPATGLLKRPYFD